ncbi:NAD(+) salvage pathway protein [Saxophila tyrrhenica]|uniref:nicotinamidase n=1 Tax=Saxophila tyrrhenica TaxID=1690608 RepID=A0AAV9P352_9PEZI|nr:NAD(+) salvage pathway protein [Saxophila tyrrhenica]
MSAGKKAALICVDIQNDFCDDPDGALAVKGARALAPVWNELLSMPFAVKIATKDCHPTDHVSFASQHQGKQPFKDTITVKNPENEKDEPFTSTLWPDHCIQGSHGYELMSELDKSKIQTIIEKGQDKRVESYSAFGPPYRNPRLGNNELIEMLKSEGITEVFVVGLAYEACVMYTAKDAAKYGFQTYLIEDAAAFANKSEDNTKVVRKQLQDCGVSLISLASPEVERIRKSA